MVKNKTLKYVLIGFLVAFLSNVLLCQTRTVFSNPQRGFSSWVPAPSWDNALLTGNGIMGAMVMGQPFDETVILNHAKLYMPTTPPIKPIDQARSLEEIRKLIFEGKYEEASKIPVEISKKEGYGEGLRWTDPYIPAFDLKIFLDPSNIERYIRKVEFSNAETNVCWDDGNGIFQKKLFVSRADNVVVLQIKGSGKINGELYFERRPVDWQNRKYINENIDSTESKTNENFLIYRCKFKKRWDGSLQGYEGVGRVINRGGSISLEGNRVEIKDADEVMLLVRIEPSYDYNNSQVEKLKKSLQVISADYDTLLANHTKLHGDLFNRMKLNLAGFEQDKNLDAEVMNLAAKKRPSNAFVEKQFDAARYNIICATGINPPNLQGIWSGTWTPPWSSDFTQDGNLEVAVSSMLCGNMPELLMPLFNYEDKLLPYFRDNAKNLYGARGIQIPSRTSTHGWNIHFSEAYPLTFWNAGAGWIAGYYYDYYLYTGDRKFLEERAYPFMKEAALFYEDFLVEGKDGKYIFIPSYSPENNPLNQTSQTCINAAMDISVAKQLLNNCIEAGRILGEYDEIIDKWNSMISKMPIYEINNDGAFREWLWPGLEDNYAHRHVSHLYGLFDRIDKEIIYNPKLIDACKRAIEERMKIRRQDNGGVMVFGMVNLAWAAANMGEHEMVSDIIDWLSSRYWSNSMATYHDPGGLFNMDLSGGFPAVIIRALTYSEPGFISLLPALPQKWQKGSIEGILCRGQIEIKKLVWNKKHISVDIVSRIEQKVSIKLPGSIDNIETDTANIETKKDKTKLNLCEVTLPANRVINLNFDIL